MGKIRHKRGYKNHNIGSRKLILSKKAVSEWISWTLLVTFVIFLGTTVFFWMKDFSEVTTQDLVDRIGIAENCDQVSIDIIDVVSKNSQTLNIKVVNRYNLRVNQIIFDLYDSSNNYIWSNVSNTTLKPDTIKEIDISQNSTLTTGSIKAIPVVIREGKEIRCTEKLVEKNVTT